MTKTSIETILLFLFSDLSGYELRVLSFLLWDGDFVGTRKIHLKTDIPRTKIYHVLERLRERNLVIIENVDQWAHVVFPENWDDYGKSGQRKFKQRHGLATYQYLQKGKANLETISERAEEIKSRLNHIEDLLDVAYMKRGIPLEGL